MAEVREEVVNVALSVLLEQRGLLTVPESIRKAVTGKGHKLPDITVADLFGIRLVVEGRFSSPQAKVSLFADAKKRVEEGISPVCLAVLYPKDVRTTTGFNQLKDKLEKSSMLMRVISEGADGDWEEAGVNDIAEALRHAYDLIVSDDVVVRCVKDLEHGIDVASDFFVHTKALPQRLRSTLGIPAETKRKAKEDEED